MKAVTGALPDDEAGWAFEIKWDGMRALAFLGTGPAPPGETMLRSSNDLDATASFPEVANLAAATGGLPAVLDGELVAFDAGGRPSFGRLQQRMHVRKAVEVRLRAAETPACYVVFDLLHLDGTDLTAYPYRDRRRLLTATVSDGPGWRVPGHHDGDGAALLEAARASRLEGVMAKRADSRYEPGRRSPAWRKVKVRRRQELVIGGWQPGDGARAGKLGSLIVGYYEDGRLRYAGKVGTGFNDRELQRLAADLGCLATAQCPFDPPPPSLVARAARWVVPSLVAEVAFGEWTDDGVLRHPSYVGLRGDKAAADVVREG